MPAMVLIGCALIAFGPSFVLFAMTIALHPVRIILLVVGAFFWLLSLLATSLLWLCVVPLRDQLAFSLVFSVIFQELARFALYKLLTKAQEGLSATLTETEVKSIANHKLPFVVGFGFGLMQCLFSYVNVVAMLVGPGVIGVQGHSINYFVISAWISNGVVFNNIFWTVISFKLWKKKKYLVYMVVPMVHMFVACMSLLPVESGGFATKMITTYAVAVISTVFAFKTAGGSLGSLCQFATVCCKGAQ